MDGTLVAKKYDLMNGGGGVNYVLNGGQIATSEGTYISADLLHTIKEGDVLLISVLDGENIHNYTHEYEGGSDEYGTDDGYTFTITASTLGLSYYGGDYRNIYAKVTVLPDGQIY